MLSFSSLIRTLTALSLVASAGCKPTERAPDAAIVQFAQEPDALNPFVSPMQSAGAIAALFYSGLVTLDEQGRFQPDLAERVPTLENGDVTLSGGQMRVSYRLRQGVKWHDGTPFGPDDVVATWKLLLNPKFPALSTAGYDQISAVEAVGGDVVVTFKTPYAPYLELFPYVLSAKAIAGEPDVAKAAWSRQPVGTGPFRFERWVSGDRLSATANADYFRGKPGLSRVVVRFIPQADTALHLWRAGDLDVLQGALPDHHDDLQADAPERVFVTPTVTWEHVLFNMEHPVLKERPVRQAIAHLIDRQQIVSKAYGGVSVPAWSEVPSFSWAYQPALENRHPHDPAEAARLLDAAGWKRGPDGLRAKGTHKLAFTLLTTNDKPSRGLAAQIWRKQWAEHGIRLDIDKQPASAVFGAGQSGRLAAGRFDLALVAGLSRPDPDASYRWRSDQVPPNGQNRARYRSPVVDELLAEGQRTVAIAERKRIYHRLAEELDRDLPAIPLLYWAGIDAVSDRLSGFKPNPTLRGNLWNVWEWRLTK